MTMYPNEHTQCIHCHQRIRYVDSVLGGAWQHIFSMSIYCDNSVFAGVDGMTAEP